jgi:putative ABC transport system substrate-binding protein
MSEFGTNRTNRASLMMSVVFGVDRKWLAGRQAGVDIHLGVKRLTKQTIARWARGNQMKRRAFVGLVGGAVAWPLVARAQRPGKQHRLAFVHSGIPADKLTAAAGPFWVRRFFETLDRLGHREGGNLVVERYSAEGHSDRFAALAAEVVSHKPDVIVSNLNELVKAFLAATATIPIVGITSDPIAGDLIASLAHPGSNLTGVSVEAGPEIIAKRLEIMKEAIPSVAKVAYLLSNSRPDGVIGESYHEAAQRLGIELRESFLPQVDEGQLRRSFAEMAEQRMDAILLDGSGSFLAFRALLVELAAKNRIPVVYPYRDYVDQGGLMAFAPDLGELAERMAGDVHQIFDGARSGDIPFYLPSKFRMIVNLKTAKTIGVEIPSTFLARADEVIE